MTQTAAIIGGGVIGGGWVARFLLMGWDVRVFDPDPEAERKICEVLANARRSLPGLSDQAMPTEGALTFHTSIEEAVKGAAWIQESVPERLDLKHMTFAAIQAENAAGIIGSSTSGFKPSELQEGALGPAQILVVHPFNPVYLLPLVELVPSTKNPPEVIQSAKDTLSALGMFPLHVRAEIDAHIADRLLEAVWREALWLIKDEIATTEEIDNAIRYGFGLRWAQMGLFETYRIAGGEAGMAHFIKQFGPCLEWPWTKLIDVPELTDELVQTIAQQSEDQSGALSIRELERLRDRNLVSLMRALKLQDAGAGALLNEFDRAQADSLESIYAQCISEDAGLPITANRAVPLDWVDYNGHMNEAKYLQAFGDATDKMMEVIGCDADYIAAGSSYFTVETHIRHIDEVHAGARIHITTQVLEGRGKKMHLFHHMYEGERLLASGEHLLIHVSLETRSASMPGARVLARLEAIAAAQTSLARPVAAGAAVGIR
ncbi:MAG: carnitine 3-dehydrogenase [Litoreibacter sp.]